MRGCGVELCGAVLCDPEVASSSWHSQVHFITRYVVKGVKVSDNSKQIVIFRYLSFALLSQF